MATERNPLIDPQPNDVVEGENGRQLHVHIRKPDQVYCGVWKDDKPEGLVRSDLAQWQRDCAANNARVIQRAE